MRASCIPDFCDGDFRSEHSAIKLNLGNYSPVRAVTEYLLSQGVYGAPNAYNLIMTIPEGVHRKQGNTDILMPELGTHMTDTEIATLVNFITKQFGDPSITVTVKDIANKR